MKKHAISFAVSVSLILAASIASAHGTGPADLIGEEGEGYVIWDKFLDKQITCEELTESDFELIGEYLMGQMMGTRHDAMNTQLEVMLGKEGEEAMHATMAKRLTGCELTAAWPATANPGTMGIMNMMMGGWSPPHSFLGFSGTNEYGEPSAWSYMRGGIASIAILLFAAWGIASFAKWLKRELDVTPKN